MGVRRDPSDFHYITLLSAQAVPASSSYHLGVVTEIVVVMRRGSLMLTCEPMIYTVVGVAGVRSVGVGCSTLPGVVTPGPGAAFLRG